MSGMFLVAKDIVSKLEKINDNKNSNFTNFFFNSCWFRNFPWFYSKFLYAKCNASRVKNTLKDVKFEHQWGEDRVIASDFLPDGKIYLIAKVPEYDRPIINVDCVKKMEIEDSYRFIPNYFGTYSFVKLYNIVTNMPDDSPLPWYWRLWKWWKLFLLEIKKETDLLLK